MTSEELLAANTKLRSTSGLDADVARMMGLVVTARLADRHGMSVELRDRSPRGVVARVETQRALSRRARRGRCPSSRCPPLRSRSHLLPPPCR